jgi:hypothetical protein
MRFSVQRLCLLGSKFLRACFSDKGFHYGFAARCEATAMPRRMLPLFISGYAPGLGCALETFALRGLARTKGLAQRERTTSRRGVALASHRAAKPSPNHQLIGCGSAALRLCGELLRSFYHSDTEVGEIA